jgi:hypothetical protein
VTRPSREVAPSDDPHTEHGVVLYGKNRRSLTRSVAMYALAGLAQGDAVVLVARPEHGTGIVAELAAAGVQTQPLIDAGRLALLDAAATLDGLQIDGELVRAQFERAIAEILDRIPAGAGRPVRIFGEMVGLLWECDRFAAAIQLEEWWNALQRDRGFRLFCAYPVDVCGDAFTAENVDGVIRTHSHLLPADHNLAEALDRAMAEIVGPPSAALRASIDERLRTAWPTLPRAEATILWLRENLADHGNAIVSLARTYARRAA